METLWPQVERLLLDVSKPARYIGGEQGAQYPEHGPGRVAWLLLYPDTYEIGLPNQGLQILYEILNERPDAVAERSYAPWVDMEAAMREAGVPLFSVENHLPARAFDVMAFNLSAELVYTNVVNLIDLAGVPLHAADRGPGDLLVLAGGHCAFNPEPLADFVDAFVMGDGEEVVSEINEVLGRWLAQPVGERTRDDLRRALAGVEGVYVPALYESTYADGRLVATVPREAGVPAEVAKRTVNDLADWPYPAHPLVPLTEVVHDRLNVEVFRGCTRGCRFCQAGMITRPVRERPAEQVKAMVSQGLAWSGHDEVTLTSLSTADFSGIETTVRDIIDDPAHEGRVSVSLPSLRVDAFTVGTAAQIQKVRRTGLTFAPEGGTWRMRQVINKLITEEDLYSAVDAAFSQGWRRIKLYFLIGLPTERDEDVLGIADLGAHCVEIGRRHQKSVTVVASVGGFVPKPHTPFQWFGQDTVAELERKVILLREKARTTRGLTVRWHEPAASAAEGVASRGDRRMGAVLERVWRAGGTFQEWSERFDLSLWEDALAAEGLSLEEVAHRERGEHEPLPWDHISAGLHRDFLWTDWQDALAEAAVEDCRWTPCYDCGACTEFGLEHVVASATPPAGGSQGTGQDLAAGGRIPVRLVSGVRSGAGVA
jgi:radical SAM family uncharacterized protein